VKVPKRQTLSAANVPLILALGEREGPDSRRWSRRDVLGRHRDHVLGRS